MRFDIITLFPEMFSPLYAGVTGRTIERQLIQLYYWNPRHFAQDKHNTVDDRPYGGGPGMVMKPEPLTQAVCAIKEASRASTPPTLPQVIHLSPQGRPLKQHILQKLIDHKHFILVATRYEGVDERFITREVDQQYSLGDYVLSGGELPCMVFIDALARLLPEALGNPHSALQDSFSHGLHGLLDHPHYTRPEKFAKLAIPEVLRSGNHQAIARWRRQQSLGRTWLRRADLLDLDSMSHEEKQLLHEFIEEYRKNNENDDHD